MVVQMCLEISTPDKLLLELELIVHTFTSIVLTMDRFTFSSTDHLYSGVLGI